MSGLHRNFKSALDSESTLQSMCTPSNKRLYWLNLHPSWVSSFSFQGLCIWREAWRSPGSSLEDCFLTVRYVETNKNRTVSRLWFGFCPLPRWTYMHRICRSMCVFLFQLRFSTFRSVEDISVSFIHSNPHAACFGNAPRIALPWGFASSKAWDLTKSFFFSAVLWLNTQRGNNKTERNKDQDEGWA